jgi:vanillate O-demethylase monooxygenase subunit
MPQLRVGLPVPSQARLSTLACVERYGLVWVSLDESRAELPKFAEWEDASYRHVACAPYRWRTSPERMVENFTDFGHLGYLHDGLLGSRDDLVVPAHQVDQRGRELHYELTMEVPNTNDEFAVTAVVGSRGLQTNTYVLSLPYTIHLACRYHDTGAHRTLFFSVQPHGDGTCTGYCYQSRDFDLAGEDEPYSAFQELLAEQDRPIVESQEPAEVPLEPRTELHLSFDRVAVAYRRAIGELRDTGQDHAPDEAPSPGETVPEVGVGRKSSTVLERGAVR